MGNRLHSTSLVLWLDLAPTPWLIGDAQTWVELGEIYQPNALALPPLHSEPPKSSQGSNSSMAYTAQTGEDRARAVRAQPGLLPLALRE